jgi:hypothetical protein
MDRDDLGQDQEGMRKENLTIIKTSATMLYGGRNEDFFMVICYFKHSTNGKLHSTKKGKWRKMVAVFDSWYHSTCFFHCFAY